MDRKDWINAYIPVPLCIGAGCVMTYFSSSKWTLYFGLALIVGGVAWAVIYAIMSRSRLAIDRLSVSNALNIQITSKNKSRYGTELVVVGLRWWDAERRQFMPIATPETPPFVLLGDDVNLPVGTPRTFQLIRFLDRQHERSILGGFATGPKRFQLPRPGIWEYQMKLTWAGSDPAQQIFEYICWDHHEQPHFCNRPRR
jgi:hypothetical protein